MTETLRVDLGDRGYNIIIGTDLMARAAEFIVPVTQKRRLVPVIDEQVASHYWDRFKSSFKETTILDEPIILPAGEETKSFSRLEHLIESFLARRIDRSTVILAIGGGVIGDLTGFAASITLRGLDFIQVPTTLLAQVDSSVGGKTGINTAHGKNLAGTFHQPLLVLSDISVLETLPEREMRAGYAEIVKYALINDLAFFERLEKDGTSFFRDTAKTISAIKTSCSAKAAIVKQDEKEAGQRALLNLGHSFGHALEAMAGYDGSLLHGEAVALGMVMAFDLSVEMGLCPIEDKKRLEHHLQEMGLPIRLSKTTRWETEKLLDYMSKDKKAARGKSTLILTRGIGRAFVVKDISADQIRPTLQRAVSDLK